MSIRPEYQRSCSWVKRTTISHDWYIERTPESMFLLQYIPRNMHTVFALLCFVVVIHWLIFPYLSGLLHWHCGNLTIAPVPAKQPWLIWINTSCEFIMNDCITTTKQSTTKPCAYFLGYTVPAPDETWGDLSVSSHRISDVAMNQSRRTNPLACFCTPRFNEVERGYTGFTLSVCGQNGVRSVSSTIFIGSISYLHILSSNFRRSRVTFVSKFRNLKFWRIL